MKKFSFSGINALQSVGVNLVKIQQSNIKISHNILKVYENFDVKENPVFMDYSKEHKSMYLVILKKNDEKLIEETCAKLLNEKYYTFSNNAISNFVGGSFTELDYVPGSIEEDEDFVYIQLKTVITGEEGRAKEKLRKEKVAEKQQNSLNSNQEEEEEEEEYDYEEQKSDSFENSEETI